MDLEKRGKGGLNLQQSPPEPNSAWLKFIFPYVCDYRFSHIVDLRGDFVRGAYDTDVLFGYIVYLAHALIYHIYALALLPDALAHLVDALG